MDPCFFIWLITAITVTYWADLITITTCLSKLWAVFHNFAKSHSRISVMLLNCLQYMPAHIFGFLSELIFSLYAHLLTSLLLSRFLIIVVLFCFVFVFVNQLDTALAFPVGKFSVHIQYCTIMASSVRLIKIKQTVVLQCRVWNWG